MTLAVGTYIQFLEPDGTDSGFRFQNFFQGETRTYQGDSYIFGAFGFSGGSLDLQGANIQASLVFSLNELSFNVLSQASEEFWLVRIRTVWLLPDTLEETTTHSEELYAVTGFNHDSSRISVELGSPLDAVRTNAPRRVLTVSMVGALPSTGQINLN